MFLDTTAGHDIDVSSVGASAPQSSSTRWSRDAQCRILGMVARYVRPLRSWILAQLAFLAGESPELRFVELVVWKFWPDELKAACLRDGGNSFCCQRKRKAMIEKHASHRFWVLLRYLVACSVGVFLLCCLVSMGVGQLIQNPPRAINMPQNCSRPLQCSKAILTAKAHAQYIPNCGSLQYHMGLG